MLRIFVLAIGLLIVAGGVILWQQTGAWPAACILVALGALIFFGLLLEPRYRTRGTTANAQPTDERFIDPTTGKRMQVYYNAATGERTYKPLE